MTKRQIFVPYSHEDYVRVELILAVFLSFDEILSLTEGNANIPNESKENKKMLEHKKLEFQWETLESEGCWDYGFLNVHVYWYFF